MKNTVIRRMRVSTLSLITFILASCGINSSNNNSVMSTTLNQIATVNITIEESKVLYTSRVNAFEIDIDKKTTPSEQFTCRERHFYAFEIEAPSGSFVSCRGDKSEVLGWLEESTIGSTIAWNILDSYDGKKWPLYLQNKSFYNDEKDFFLCDSDLSKVLVKEYEKSKVFQLQLKCRQVSKLSDDSLKLVNTLENPGPFAALMSYRGFKLPAIASDDTSFKKVTKALAGKIPNGSYTGVMSTLGKTCQVEVSGDAKSLKITHTITSSAKPISRKIEFISKDILGFVEGDIFSDPLEIKGAPIGTFSAVEINNTKKENDSIFIRFEKNTNREGQIVRINGPEAYCRRLEKI